MPAHLAYRQYVEGATLKEMISQGVELKEAQQAVEQMSGRERVVRIVSRSQRCDNDSSAVAIQRPLVASDMMGTM